MTIVIHHSAQLWDIAGVDGLQVMEKLFGKTVDRIALFQSIDVTLDETHSILRLCEGNFRIAWYGNPELFEQHIQQAKIDDRVWVKRPNWMVTLLLNESARLDLTTLAIPKPPHRLHGLPLNCAVPARIEGISVLIWHHLVSEQPCFELQMARDDLEPIKAKLSLQHSFSPQQT
jgi:hypothetical protein